MHLLILDEYMGFIYLQSFTNHLESLFVTIIMTTELLVGFFSSAQLVERCTGIAVVMGLDPVRA